MNPARPAIGVRTGPPHQACGFSLIEVMVGLIVISVGLLGVARMQALSLSSTNGARLRSLASIEAASLASAMHADRAYWAYNYPTVATAGTAITASDAALQATVDCSTTGSAPCSAAALAASDLAEWVTNYTALFPAGTSTITCTSATNPLSCTIQLAWTENVVSKTQQGAAANATTLQAQTYLLYVQP